MRMTLKRLLLLLMTLVLCLSFVACDEQNNGTEKEDDVNYSFELKGSGDDRYYVLKKYTLSDSAKELLEKAEGGYYFSAANTDTSEAYLSEKARYNALKTVVIPETHKIPDTDVEVKVTEIAADAFKNRSEIEVLTVGSNIETIGAGAFSGCSGLKEATLPFVGGKVKAYNAEKSFGYIFGTTEYTGGTSITQNYNVSGTTTVFVPTNLKKITITAVDIIEDVTAEGDTAGNKVIHNVVSAYAFHNVTTIQEIVFTSNDNICAIPDFAFYGCTGIVTINLPASVKRIGKSAFATCSNLMKITTGADKAAWFGGLSGLEYIFDSAFESCAKLGSKDNGEELTLASSLKEIGTLAFKETAFKKITLASTTKAQDYSFSAMPNLTTFVGGDLEPQAIYNCENYNK